MEIILHLREPVLKLERCHKENGWAYHEYKVIKDINGIKSLKIAPAFGQPGGGVQFELPNNISYLVKNRFLKEIFFGR